MPMLHVMKSIDNSNILIHIGLHKTASSFLQGEIFSRAEYGYLRWPDDQVTIHELMVMRTSFQDAAPEAVDRIRHHVDLATQRGLTFVLSHERLAGHPASGGYDARLIADRLHRAMPNARVLIVLREQNSIIRSNYSQYITEGGPLSLRRFLTQPSDKLRKIPSFDFAYFEYDLCIRYYQNLFGSDRVLALPYELLNRDSDDFLRRIFSFTNTPYNPIAGESQRTRLVNARQNQVVQIIRRLINRWFRSPMNNTALLDLYYLPRILNRILRFLSNCLPGTLDRFLLKRQGKIIRDAIADRYRESNARVSSLIGINLSEYGYDCGADQFRNDH